MGFEKIARFGKSEALVKWMDACGAKFVPEMKAQKLTNIKGLQYKPLTTDTVQLSETVKPKLVNSEGYEVARELKDLPPLQEGWVRLVHRTKMSNPEKIVQEGFKGGKNGIHWTTDEFYSEKDFWQLMANDSRGFAFGKNKIIMDMPADEYKIVAGSASSGPRFYNEKDLIGLDLSDAYGVGRIDALLCPSKYIVGCIEQKFPWNEKCIEIFRNMASKNPIYKPPKTDLNMFKRKEIISPIEEEQLEIQRLKALNKEKSVANSDISKNDSGWDDDFY